MGVLMVVLVAVILTQWLNNGDIRAVASPAVLSVLIGIISIAILLMLALLLADTSTTSVKLACPASLYPI